MNRSCVRTIHPHWAIAASAMIVAACIAPHPVAPEIEVFEQVQFADDVLVTVGPRRLLEKLSSTIAHDPRGVVVVDGLRFRDAAFPEGGWRLTDLLGATEHRNHVISELDVDYLVLIGPARIEEYGEEKGEMLVLVPGAVWGEETSSLNAAIIDLRSGRADARFVVKASGTYRAANYLLYMVGTDPMTESAVLTGLSEYLVDWLIEHSQIEGIGIALLAAESIAEPFHSAAAESYASGPAAEAKAINWIKSLGLYDGLEKRDGRFFEVDATVPYTGHRKTSYADGRRAAELHFSDGLEHGLYTIWDTDGSKQREAHYERGRLNGLDTSWNKNGRKIGENHYREGQLHGLSTRWRSNGSISRQVCFHGGKMVDVPAKDCQ